MRVNSILAMLLLSALSLSGCLGFGDEPADAGHADECDASDDHEACHAGDDGNGTADPVVDDNATVEIPNSPPVPMLTMTDSAGNNLTNMSFIMAGTNITFSPNGTTDADGLNTISLGGLFVQDRGNVRGRSASLVTDGVLMTAEFEFLKEGPVLAVLSVLDAAGASAAVVVSTYVNALQSSSNTFDGAAQSGVNADSCKGLSASTGSETTLIDQIYSQKMKFETLNGSRWIEAKSDKTNVEIAICTPDGDNLSGRGQTVSTDEFAVPNSVEYYVFAVNKGSPGNSVNVDIIVHWEPKPAPEA